MVQAFTAEAILRLRRVLKPDHLRGVHRCRLVETGRVRHEFDATILWRAIRRFDKGVGCGHYSLQNVVASAVKRTDLVRRFFIACELVLSCFIWQFLNSP